MKYLVLFIIQIYWRLIPENKRGKCIFRVSCSNYVYQVVQKNGFIEGLKAFKYRFINCRYGAEVFVHPIDNTKQMILPNKEIVREDEIALRLI